MKSGEKDEDSKNSNGGNYGHTQNEWGKPIADNKKEPSIIFTYKMKWESTI